MHPAFLDNMSWEMAEVYGAITDQILINLARHFPFFQYENELPQSAFAYQASMLAQMGQVNRETVRIIRNGLKDADEALKNSLEQAIMDAVKSTSPELWEGVKRGVFAPPVTPVLAPNQYRAFQLYYAQASDKLNLVNTVMLESTMSAYTQTVSDVVSNIEVYDRINRTQQALDIAAGETVTGVSSWNQALRHATDRMKDGGVVGFVDHAGHQWSAEAYTAMDIRTTVMNTGRAAVWETNQNFGNDLYLVSYHNGARPLCYDWQNKVISSTDNARVTYDLDGNEIRVYAQSETTYGEPAGLFGINCKHYPSPFIPYVSVIDGQPQDKETNDRVYKESQEQRRLERKLREEKRDLMMAKAQGRPQEEIDRLQEKCRQSSKDIDEFCKETGRARHRDREAVYTQREFPDKDKYDVSKFEHEQKDLMDKYYRDGGAQQVYRSEGINSGLQTHENRGIINTKIDNDGNITSPMDEQRFNLMREGLERHGVKVIQAEGDDLRYLQSISAEASYGNGYIMHMGKVPSASAMFEETIHSAQARIYGEALSYDPIERAAREIAAQEKLLKNAQAYGFTPDDYSDIQKNRDLWAMEFERLTGRGYDPNDRKSEYYRGV